jgi:hypothetical protein
MKHTSVQDWLDSTPGSSLFVKCLQQPRNPQKYSYQGLSLRSWLIKNKHTFNKWTKRQLIDHLDSLCPNRSRSNLIQRIGKVLKQLNLHFSRMYTNRPCMVNYKKFNSIRSAVRHFKINESVIIGRLKKNRAGYQYLD